MAGFSRLGTAEILLSLVLLGISTWTSPAALRAARFHGLRARAAFWLSLSSTGISALLVAVGVVAAAFKLRGSGIGPALACGGGALMLLASFVVWPPWRRPRKLQLVREVQVALWWCATLSVYLRP
jgi:hypothetical protein